MASSLKKTKLKLDLFTDMGILVMIKKSIRGGICHAIHQHPKDDNKYIKSYDGNK